MDHHYFIYHTVRAYSVVKENTMHSDKNKTWVLWCRVKGSFMSHYSNGYLQIRQRILTELCTNKKSGRNLHSNPFHSTMLLLKSILNPKEIVQSLLIYHVNSRKLALAHGFLICCFTDFFNENVCQEEVK